MHDAQDLIKLFDEQFKQTEKTVLIKGDSEPLYLPAKTREDYHQVIFAHGFFSSALHEISHWCIAGIQRRRQLDYGYWYAPDGRSVDEQVAFAAVEAKPQALEWIFHQAAGHKFVVSLDNLSLDPSDFDFFKTKVVQEIERYQLVGLPKRAAIFHRALAEAYGQSTDINDYSFHQTML